MIYKRKDSPWWWAAYYVKAPDGRLIKRACSTKKADRDDALDFERELKRATEGLKEKKRIETFLFKTAEAMTEKTIERPGMPLAAVWEKYSTHVSQKKRTERTQSSKKIVWERFCKWLGTEFPQVENLADISREIAEIYLKTLSTKRSATYNNNKNSLSAIWQTLMVSAGLKENIWRLFSGAENDSIRYRDFSLEEIKAILAASTDLWRCLVAAGFYTGLRLTDCVHLRKSQIQGDYIELIPEKTKRKKKKVTIYIHEHLKKILDYQISRTPAKEDYIFPDAVEQYGTRGFQSAFSEILEKCEDEKGDPKPIRADSRGGVGFHSLRHSFVSTNEKLGADMKVIQGIVGHGSPLMTEHYTHDSKASQIISKMPSLLTE